jgi:hypothetical protein
MAQLEPREIQEMQREMQNAMQPYFALMARVSFLAPMSFVVEGDKITPDPMPEPFAGVIERLREMAMMEARHVANCYHFDLENIS